MMDRIQVAHLAAQVLHRGVETEADEIVRVDAVRDLMAGKAEVWGLPDSALISRIWDDVEGNRYLELGPAVGDLNEILALSPQIDAWASAVGCQWIDVSYSRDGWERLLPALGYELHEGGVMRKNLRGH